MKQLDKQQTEIVAGAVKRPPFTTLAVGEEGGGTVTTLAIGEEGGCFTTFRVGEEGPIYTTLALGEEGGGASATGGASALGSF
jgi:hypothetical protein